LNFSKAPFWLAQIRSKLRIARKRGESAASKLGGGYAGRASIEYSALQHLLENRVAHRPAGQSMKRANQRELARVSRARLLVS
jgi:hypothetical protein